MGGGGGVERAGASREHFVAGARKARTEQVGIVAEPQHDTAVADVTLTGVLKPKGKAMAPAATCARGNV